MSFDSSKPIEISPPARSPAAGGTVYCCVSRENEILYSYNGGDRELEALAILCLESTPPYHSWYSHTAGGRTFGYLIDGDYTFFAIVDPSVGNLAVLRFLQQLCDGIHKSSQNGFHDELVSAIRRLMASLEATHRPASSFDDRSPEAGSSSDASPSTNAPLLGKHDKKRVKERVIEIRDGSEEHMDRGLRIDMSPEPAASLQKSASTRARALQSARRLWWRHVKIVAAIDALLCLVLFAVWLAVCRGFECVS